MKVGTADNEDDAYTMSMQHKPDIVLMDINLGEGSGFDATEKINDSLPKARVIGLSLHDDITYVKKFLSIGAKGYLTKNTSKVNWLRPFMQFTKEKPSSHLTSRIDILLHF